MNEVQSSVKREPKKAKAAPKGPPPLIPPGEGPEKRGTKPFVQRAREGHKMRTYWLPDRVVEVLQKVCMPKWECSETAAITRLALDEEVRTSRYLFLRQQLQLNFKGGRQQRLFRDPFDGVVMPKPPEPLTVDPYETARRLGEARAEERASAVDLQRPDGELIMYGKGDERWFKAHYGLGASDKMVMQAFTEGFVHRAHELNMMLGAEQMGVPENEDRLNYGHLEVVDPPEYLPPSHWEQCIIGAGEFGRKLGKSRAREVAKGYHMNDEEPEGPHLPTKTNYEALFRSMGPAWGPATDDAMKIRAKNLFDQGFQEAYFQEKSVLAAKPAMPKDVAAAFGRAVGLLRARAQLRDKSTLYPPALKAAPTDAEYKSLASELRDRWPTDPDAQKRLRKEFAHGIERGVKDAVEQHARGELKPADPVSPKAPAATKAAPVIESALTTGTASGSKKPKAPAVTLTLDDAKSYGYARGHVDCQKARAGEVDGHAIPSDDDVRMFWVDFPVAAKLGTAEQRPWIEAMAQGYREGWAKERERRKAKQAPTEKLTAVQAKELANTLGRQRAREKLDAIVAAKGELVDADVTVPKVTDEDLAQLHAQKSLAHWRADGTSKQKLESAYRNGFERGVRDGTLAIRQAQNRAAIEGGPMKVKKPVRPPAEVKGQFDMHRTTELVEAEAYKMGKVARQDDPPLTTPQWEMLLGYLTQRSIDVRAIEERDMRELRTTAEDAYAQGRLSVGSKAVPRPPPGKLPAEDLEAALVIVRAEATTFVEQAERTKHKVTRDVAHAAFLKAYSKVDKAFPALQKEIALEDNSAFYAAWEAIVETVVKPGAPDPQAAKESGKGKAHG